MTNFIDDHRAAHGVGSIFTVLQVAPSAYYARLATRADPTKASARQQRDAILRPKIQKIWDANWQVYGVRKAWRQLCREGEAVARCTITGLMAGMGLRGAVRGKAVKTTIPDASVPCPRDIGVFSKKKAPMVNRQFRAPAPNLLRPFSDAKGINYRVTDALEQALYARRPVHMGGLIHHSDRPFHGLKANRCRATDGQYLSIRDTERLAKAGVEPSVGSVGDACDRASGRHWFKTTGEGLGRNDQRSLQNRGDPSAKFMENDG